MSEVFEGLYKGFGNLLGSQSDHQKLQEEFRLIFQSFKSSHLFWDLESHQARTIIFENELALAYLKNFFDKEVDAEELRAKTDRLYRESILNYKLRLESTNGELVNEISKNSILQQQVETLSHQIKEMRKKFMKKSKETDPNDEMICTRCKRMFKQSENFNWSCRTHLNEFNGTAFWCCGSQDKNSAGCFIRKHESLELKDSSELIGSKSNNFCSVTSIQSCRAIGHTIKECPKDPNIKSITGAKSQSVISNQTSLPISNRISLVKEKIHVEDYKSEIERVNKQRKSKMRCSRLSEHSLTTLIHNNSDLFDSPNNSPSGKFYLEFQNLPSLKPSSP